MCWSKHQKSGAELLQRFYSPLASLTNAAPKPVLINKRHNESQSSGFKDQCVGQSTRILMQNCSKGSFHRSSRCNAAPKNLFNSSLLWIRIRLKLIRGHQSSAAKHQGFGQITKVLVLSARVLVKNSLLQSHCTKRPVFCKQENWLPA